MQLNQVESQINKCHILKSVYNMWRKWGCNYRVKIFMYLEQFWKKQPEDGDRTCPRQSVYCISEHSYFCSCVRLSHKAWFIVCFRQTSYQASWSSVQGCCFVLARSCLQASLWTLTILTDIRRGFPHAMSTNAGRQPSCTRHTVARFVRSLTHCALTIR